MADLQVFRVLSYFEEPPIHIASVVTDGSSAFVVYPGEVENSEDPGSRIARYSLAAGKPTTPAGWANLVANSGSYYGVSRGPDSTGGTVDSLVEQEVSALGSENLSEVGPSEDSLSFSDEVDAIRGADPEASSFLDNGETATDPGGMREYVNLILRSNNALHLNPGLKDWLAGGPPPTDDTFDGIIWSAE